MFSWGTLCAYSTFFTFIALAYNQRCYTLSVIVWGVALLLTGLFAHFKKVQRKATFVTLISTLCALFLILTLVALKSPHPPFIDSALMQACIIIMWGTESFLCYICSTHQHSIAYRTQVAQKHSNEVSFYLKKHPLC